MKVCNPAMDSFITNVPESDNVLFCSSSQLISGSGFPSAEHVIISPTA